MKVLVFLWHLSQQGKIVSGGYRRFLEVLRRAPHDDFRYVVIENKPSLRLLDERIDYEPVEFGVPLARFEDILFFRLVIWIYSAVKMTFLGIKFCRKHHFDLLVTPGGELFTMAIPAYMTHFVCNVPLLLTLQQIPPGGLSSLGLLSEHKRFRESGFGRKSLFLSLYVNITRILLIRLYNSVSSVIAVSDSLRRQLIAYGAKSHIYVIGNGINIEDLANLAKRKKIYEAIFVGRHTPEKGIFDILMIWSIVTKRITGAKLVLVGYGVKDVMDIVHERIRKYHLENNIILKGVVSEREKGKLYMQSRLFIFPSKQEAAPLAPAEALACGLPVVCYDILPMRELYNHHSVIRCPVNDPETFAGEVSRLLLNEPLRNELSEGAPRFAERFDWDASARAEYAIYRRFITRCEISKNGLSLDNHY